MTESFDPTLLKPEACRTLEEPELAVAVALKVFGDDLSVNGEARLLNCLSEFSVPRHYYAEDQPSNNLLFQDAAVVVRVVRRDTGELFGKYPVPIQWVRSGRHGIDILWVYRDEGTWQSDLEAHVAAWRAEPPELTDSLAVSMFIDDGMPLYRSGLVPFPPILSSQWVVRPFTKAEPNFPHDDFRIAVFRAALYQAASGAWKRENHDS